MGIIRACADDIGAALRSADVLPRLAATFKDAENLAGLTLKMKKTNFIPLNMFNSDKVISSLRLWISSNVPHWSEVQIVDCARYLGAFLGPKSANVAWSSPITKWSNRTSTISASGVPLCVSVWLYNTRALSSYHTSRNFQVFQTLYFHVNVHYLAGFCICPGMPWRLRMSSRL